MSYVITKDENNIYSLKSNKYRVTATKAKGHIWIAVSGPGTKRWTRKGLTSIHSAVTDFEMRVILLHFSRQARQFGKAMPNIRYVNYADIFGSVFE